jgi:hypothetical protein
MADSAGNPEKNSAAPVVRMKGFQPRTNTPAAPPETVSAAIPEVTAKSVAARFKPAPQVATPIEVDTTPVEAAKKFDEEAAPVVSGEIVPADIDTKSIRDRFRSAAGEAAPAELPMAATAASYQADTDAQRVSRRQWWKYNLYIKSGRQAADQGSS